MIKKVLELISRGKTLAEIAEELNMEFSALTGMLDHLVKLGYLQEAKREDTSICSSCPLREVCSKRNYRVYYLTEKGKRVVRESH